ncbi:DUF1403 family protein [Shinella sp. M27]|uniref:DUF1403 family protein n=1 Tax=Shinella sp. M27 TaxID=3368614 RepID=UPI003B9ED4E5
MRTAGVIVRRAETLRTAALNVWTKGAGVIVQVLLDYHGVAASAPGSNLSRWSTTRLLDRLEGFGAVQELSRRSAFRIHGLRRWLNPTRAARGESADRHRRTKSSLIGSGGYSDRLALAPID